MPRPSNALRARCYDIASSPLFDHFIMGVILGNVLVGCTTWLGPCRTHPSKPCSARPPWKGLKGVCKPPNGQVMAMPYESASARYEQGLSYANTALTFVFIAEAVIKNLAMGPRLYIKDNWNKVMLVGRS